MNIFFIILAISSVLAFIGYIWLVIVGFRRNLVWGILVLLFSPLTAIIFAVLNWFDAKRAFITFIIPAIVMYGTLGYMYTKIGPKNLAEINKRIETGELKLNETMRVIDRAMKLQGSQKLFEEVAPAEQAAQPGADGEPVAEQQTQEAVANETNEKTKQTDESAAEGKKADATAKTDNDDKKQDTQQISNEEEVDEKRASPAYPKLSEVKPDPLAQQKKQEDSDFVLVRFENVKNYKGRYFVIYTVHKTFLRGLLIKADNSALYLNRKLFGGSFEYRVAKNKIAKIYMLKKEFILERDKNRLPTP